MSKKSKNGTTVFKLKDRINKSDSMSMTNFDRKDDSIIFSIVFNQREVDVSLSRKQLKKLNSHIKKYLDQWKA